MIEYTKYFGKNWYNSSEDGKLNRLGTTLGVAAGAIGLVSGGLALKKQLSDNDKFTVVFRNARGPQKMIVRAQDKISARNKVQSRSNGTDYKVFQVPHENDAAMEYYEHLGSPNSSI